MTALHRAHGRQVPLQVMLLVVILTLLVAFVVHAFVQEQHPELEVEVHDGGQPHYPLLFGAE